MHGLLDVLDSRSFSSLWYWLLLTVTWTWVGRGALGIPTDLVRAVRRRSSGGPTAGDEGSASAAPTTASPESLLLLDWLSLVTPRWQVPERDGTVLMAVGAFLMTVLAVLGFVYRSQLAQAMFLLLAPLLLLVVMRVRLAARLRAILSEAEASRRMPDMAAFEAARQISGHMRATLALSMSAVAAAALWGTAWLAARPMGF